MSPKFNVGDRVHCYRKNNRYFYGFDFVGEVKRVNDTGIGIEYLVSNAPRNPSMEAFPLLIWESEMKLVPV